MDETRRQELLARFAQGSLGEEERHALFEEALGDQALFDTLVEEDALRELLQHESARTAVLESLRRTPQRPRRARFRPRMAMLASLAAAAMVVLWTRGPAGRDLLEATRPPDAEAATLWHAAGSAPVSRSLEPLGARLEIARGTSAAGRFRPEEALSIEMAVSADAWVSVVLLPPRGGPRLLYPRDRGSSGRLAQGAPTTLGALRAPAISGTYRIRLVAVPAEASAAPPAASVLLGRLADGEAAIAEASFEITP